MRVAGRTQKNPGCGTQGRSGTIWGSVAGMTAALIYLGIFISDENNKPVIALAFPVIIGAATAIGGAFDYARHRYEEQRRTATVLLNTTNCQEHGEDPLPTTEDPGPPV